MGMQVRLLVAFVCYYSGLVYLVRWWTKRSGKKLIILNYHQASGGDLRRHLLYLRRYYRMMHLEEALEELYAPDKENRHDEDRRTPLVLTFDDGYRDNYTHAFALVCELQVPITIFLVPGYVESGGYFWWLESKRLIQYAQVDKVTLEGRTYRLDQSQECALLAREIDAHLYGASSVAEREAFLERMRAALEVSALYDAEDEADIRPLTWAQIREMEESGWVSFGAHTVHHPLLAGLVDPLEVRYEIEECRIQLEQKLGHAVPMLAYPFGQPEEVGAKALEAARAAGYRWILTTIQGFNTAQSDPQQLRRIYGDRSRHWLVMAVGAAGIWASTSYLLKRPGR